MSENAEQPRELTRAIGTHQRLLGKLKEHPTVMSSMVISSQSEQALPFDLVHKAKLLPAVEHVVESNLSLPFQQVHEDKVIWKLFVAKHLHKPLPSVPDTHVVLDINAIEAARENLKQNVSGLAVLPVRAKVQVGSFENGISSGVISEVVDAEFVRCTFKSCSLLVRRATKVPLRENETVLLTFEPHCIRAHSVRRQRPSQGTWTRRVEESTSTVYLQFTPEEGSREAAKLAYNRKRSRRGE